MHVSEEEVLERERWISLEDWLRERSERKSQRFPNHSAHFDRFSPRLIEVPPGYATDYLGNRWPTRFGFAESPGKYETKIPDVSEEYFEFLDIFEAAMDAQSRFTMHEWGAGFARWSSLGVAAARECGIENVRVACVEAEPKHLAFAIENLWSLGVRGDNLRAYPFALSGQTGADLFVIGQPNQSDTDDPWYGQALNDMQHYRPNGRSYYGQPELENPKGWRAVQVFVEPASYVLEDHDYIDIIDMDIQGAEADAVEESIDQLNAKVRRLHIGTHGASIEERLRNTLHANEWILLRDLPNHARSETPYGTVYCTDGVQSWFNPRFPPAEWLALTKEF